MVRKKRKQIDPENYVWVVRQVVREMIPHLKMPVDDTEEFSIGQVALTEAAIKHRPPDDQGDFVSYANSWVRGAISRHWQDKQSEFERTVAAQDSECLFSICVDSTVEMEAEKAEEKRNLWRAIRRLQGPERDVLTMLSQGASIEEICDAVDMQPVDVKGVIRDASVRVREMLTRDGGVV